MLNIKTTNFVFFPLFLILNILYIFFSINLIFYLIWIVSYISILIYGSFFIGSNFYLKTICSKANNKKEIAITFDDGPVKEITPLVLEVLKEFQVKASFFCIGEKIAGNEDVLKSIDSQGHIIGNHTFSHSNWFDFYSSKKMIDELSKTEDIIYKIIGEKTKFFRPPFGVTNPALKKAVTNLNYSVIGWSVRSLDTLIKNEEKILSRLMKKLKSGDIILFHDTCPEIVIILQKFLKYALENGYKILSLDELIEIKAYKVNVLAP